MLQSQATGHLDLQELQNHALQDVSSLHYDRYDYLKEKRAAMDIWNDYFNDILKKTQIPSSV